MAFQLNVVYLCIDNIKPNPIAQKHLPIKLNTAHFSKDLLGIAYKIGYDEKEPEFFDRLISDIQDNYSLVLATIGHQNMCAIAQDVVDSVNNYVKDHIIW